MKRSPLEVCNQNRSILGGFDNAKLIGEAIESGSDYADLTYSLPLEAYELIEQLSTNFVLKR